MDKYDHVRKKAITLRKEGKSLLDICEMLAMPKSTVYYWIKDIPNPNAGKPSARLVKARRKAAEANKARHVQLRREAYEEGLRTVDELVQDVTFRDFVVMYMAEGFKRNRNVASIANSDPHVVKLCNRWIRELANPQRTITYRIQCHVDDDEEELKAFWAEELGIDPDQVSIMRKTNSGNLSGRKWRSEYGVMEVRVNDTYLRAKLQAWMDWMRDSW